MMRRPVSDGSCLQSHLKWKTEVRLSPFMSWLLGIQSAWRYLSALYRCSCNESVSSGVARCDSRRVPVGYDIDRVIRFHSNFTRRRNVMDVTFNFPPVSYLQFLDPLKSIAQQPLEPVIVTFIRPPERCVGRLFCALVCSDSLARILMHGCRYSAWERRIIQIIGRRPARRNYAPW